MKKFMIMFLAVSFLLITFANNGFARRKKQNRGAGNKHRKAKRLKKYDADGDGKLSKEEKTAMKADRKQKKADNKAKRLEKYDADGDGKLSKEEKIAMKTALDTDGDGKVSREERKTAFSTD